MNFNPKSIFPRDMIIGNRPFKGELDIRELRLYRTEKSILLYAYYIQGRDKEVRILVSDKNIDIESPEYMYIIGLPKHSNKDLYYDEENFTQYEVYETDSDYFMRVKEYYALSAVKVPDLGDDAYSCMFDIYTLCSLFDTYISINDLSDNITDLFIYERIYFDPEVEIALCILSQRYRFHLKKKSGNNHIDSYKSKQNTSSFVNPDPTKTKKQYIRSLVKMLPKLYMPFISKIFYSSNNIAYPYTDIRPIGKYGTDGKLHSIDKYNMKLVQNVDIHNDILIVKHSTLMKRLKEHVPSFLNKYILKSNSNKSGICLAGGYLTNLSSDVAFNKGFYKTSDLDLFVYGTDEGEKIKLVENLITELVSKNYQLSQKGSVIQAEGEYTIQIVCSLEEHPYQIIYRFDTSCVQIAWDGKDIIITPDFLYYGSYGLTYMFPPVVVPNRVYKWIKRGFVPVSRDPYLLGHKIDNSQFYIGDNDLIMNGTRELSSESTSVGFTPKTIEEIMDSIYFDTFNKTAYSGYKYLPLTPEYNNIDSFYAYGSIMEDQFRIKLIHRETDFTLKDALAYDQELRKLIDILPHTRIKGQDKKMRNLTPEEIVDRIISKYPEFSHVNFNYGTLSKKNRDKYRNIRNTNYYFRNVSYPYNMFNCNAVILHSELAKAIYRSIWRTITTHEGLRNYYYIPIIRKPSIAYKVRSLRRVKNVSLDTKVNFNLKTSYIDNNSKHTYQTEKLIQILKPFMAKVEDAKALVYHIPYHDRASLFNGCDVQMKIKSITMIH